MPTPKRHQCALKGCLKLAAIRGRYCSTHYQRDAAQGDPGQRPLHIRVMKPYRRDAHEFVSKFHDHPATLAALSMLDEARVTAFTSPQRGLRTSFARICSEGIASEEILVEALAMHLARYYDSRLFVNDRAFVYQVGRGVLILRPLQRNALGHKVKHGGPPRRQLGYYLIETLAPYLAGAVAHIEATRAAVEKRARDIRVPFPVE